MEPRRALDRLHAQRARPHHVRGAGRTAQQREDVAHAEQDLATIQRELTELDRDFEADAEAIAQAPVAVTVERREVKPRKGDTEILRAALLWVP